MPTMIPNPYISALFATLGVSLLSLIGGFTLFKSKKSKPAHTPYLVSFAAGIMLAATFFDILPEAFDHSTYEGILMTVFAGIVFSFLLERSVLWHHHHHDDTHNIKPTVWLILIGDAIHNFVDGVAIAASFLVSPAAGIATTLAISAHEIPQELADFSILVHAGIQRRQALILNLISALTAIIGTVGGLLFLSHTPTGLFLVLGFIGGMFIYISCADLIPDLHESTKHQSGIPQTILFLVGIATMITIATLTPDDEPHSPNTLNPDSQTPINYEIWKTTDIRLSADNNH